MAKVHRRGNQSYSTHNDHELAKKAANAAHFCAQPPDFQTNLISKVTREAAEILENAKNTAPQTYVKPFVDRFEIAKMATLTGEPMAVSLAILELAAIFCELTEFESTKHE